MNGISHRRLTLFTLGFGFYHAALGIVHFAGYQRPIPAAISIALYLVAIGWATGHGPGLALPLEAVIFALLTAVAVPILGIYAIGDVADSGNLTWFTVGIGLLMAVLAVRRQKKIAWAGTIIMSVEMLIWSEVEFLISGEIIGPVMLVVGALGLSWALNSSQRASEEFLSRALVVDGDRQALSAARAESRLRMREILDSSLPLLRLIEQKKGKLTASGSRELLIAEAGIRDQIRARGLQNKKLVEAVLRARKKGLEVQLLDDGGMKLLEASEKAKIIKKLVQSLDSLSTGKVVIRSVSGEAWAVTLLAHSPGSDAPDVFLRL